MTPEQVQNAPEANTEFLDEQSALALRIHLVADRAGHSKYGLRPNKCGASVIRR